MTVTRDELAEAVRDAFGDALAPEADASWDTVVALGLPMVAVPEAAGGLGLGDEAIAALHHELGRALVPGPAIAHLLATTALAAATGSTARDDLLTRAMAGEVMTASLAAGVPGAAVPDADRASHLLIATRQRVMLVPLDRTAPRTRTTWDRTRRLFDLDPPADGVILAEGDEAMRLADRIDTRRSLALAADSLGGAAAILERTIDYLGTRRQFDRPLAMFQALKHRVADLRTALAAGEALLWSRAAAPTMSPADAASLKAHATRVYADIAEEAIQLHGGIGLTTEHPCHLFLKRALLNRALGGDNDRWDEEAGRQLLATT